MAPPENFKGSLLFKQMPVSSALGERQGREHEEAGRLLLIPLLLEFGRRNLLLSWKYEEWEVNIPP